MTARPAGRRWLGQAIVPLVALVAMLPGAATADAPTPASTSTGATEDRTPDASPTPTPTPTTPAAADCEARADFEHQLVRCRVRGLDPGGDVVLQAQQRAGAEAAPSEWIGGVRAAADGRAEASVALPCATTGLVAVEVSGPTADGGRFRHRQDLDLPGRCAESPLAPPDTWALVAAGLVVVTAVVVGVGAWRHRTRRRRVSDGRRRGGRSARGPGRRRPPRRRTRHRSRARRRRRRSR